MRPLAVVLLAAAVLYRRGVVETKTAMCGAKKGRR